MASFAGSKLLLRFVRRGWSSRSGSTSSGWFRPVVLEGNAVVTQLEAPFHRPLLSNIISRPSSHAHHHSAVNLARVHNSILCGAILERAQDGGLSPAFLSEVARNSLAVHMRLEGAHCMTFSRIAHSNAKIPDASKSDGPDTELSEEKAKIITRSLGTRIRTLLSGLGEVPAAALGLGLAGAIPFVGLTPGIATLLPLPVALSSIHTEAQAAYGAIILTFLGGPHWGLAMTDYRRPSALNFSRKPVQTFRYVWSVVPSLVAWPALLLDPVPKFSLLLTSFGVVLGVDATFARMGLVPSWYMPLRLLLTAIAMLSMTSSLIVSAAVAVTTY